MRPTAGPTRAGGTSMRRRWHNLRKSLLRSALPLLRCVPPRAATRWIGHLGHAEFALLPGVRGHLVAAVERERDSLHADWDVPRVARQLAANQVRAWARDLLLEGRSPRSLDQMFDVRGRDHLDEAFARNRGVLLLGNHYGSQLLAGCWMIRQGMPWRMFGERPRNVSRLLGDQFDLDGPLGQDKLFISRRTNPAEAATAILRAARVLKEGMALNIAADVRWSGPLTADGRFLGRTYRFSTTWVTLAAMTGAAVVPTFCRITPDGLYEIEFAPQFLVPPAARAAELAGPYVQRALDQIEDHVRRDPTNSNDYFFWANTASAA